ncbi:MAG: hypothetical protein AABY64_11195 [Bdellovibrionota bacterium]
MKTAIFFSLLIFTTQTFAALPIFGTWYNVYSSSGDSFLPESLTQIGEDGTIKWEVLFPNSIQKQVVVFKAVITADSVQTISIVSQTNCSNASMQVDPTARAYTVSGDVLKFAGFADRRRATAEQIQKFATLQEGCR